MSLFILVLIKLKASYKEYSFRLELIYHIQKAENIYNGIRSLTEV